MTYSKLYVCRRFWFSNTYKFSMNPDSIRTKDVLVAQMVKILSAMQETQVRSQGQEDPLEKEMAIYSSVLALRIPWTEKPGKLQSMGQKELDVTK